MNVTNSTQFCTCILCQCNVIHKTISEDSLFYSNSNLVTSQPRVGWRGDAVWIEQTILLKTPTTSCLLRHIFKPKTHAIHTSIISLSIKSFREIAAHFVFLSQLSSLFK